MILFEDIYNKAVILFDDPQITNAYHTNKIAFCKHMYGFFGNVSIYEPVIIGQILSDITPPSGEMEIFESDGIETAFTVEMTIPDNSKLMFYSDGKPVAAKYNPETNIVTFPEPIPAGEEFGMEYYYPGSFNGNFTSICAIDNVVNDIQIKVENILARLLVIAWAESVQNMLVDIQGLLRDTDFKITPNSQILASKARWVQQLLDQNHADQTKLAWQVRYSHDIGKFKR